MQSGKLRKMLLFFNCHCCSNCFIDNTSVHYCIVDTSLLYVFVSSFFSWLVLTTHKTKNTNGIEMQMKNEQVETFGPTRKTKQCARSRFVQHETKQLCSLHLKFVELPDQLALSTMLRVILIKATPLKAYQTLLDIPRIPL